MTFSAFFLVLASVILHATWHFISKTRNPSAAFFLVVSGASLLTTLPFALSSGMHWAALPFNFYPALIGGGLCGMLCDLGLARAYRRSEVSLAYPLARALPVLMTALLTSGFGIGKPLSPAAAAGMGLILLGCLFIPLKKLADFRWSSYRTPALAGILLAAAGTTGYTIFDSIGLGYIREFGGTGRFAGAAAYSCLRECVLFSALTVYVLTNRTERNAHWQQLLRHPHAYLAGFFAAVAYLLILIAMGFVSNVSYIQAFRQMSLLVSVGLGIGLLKEKCPAIRGAGLILIIAGLILVSL